MVPEGVRWGSLASNRVKPWPTAWRGGVLHCVRLDRSLVGGKVVIAVALGKDLEEEDGISSIGEGFISAEGMADGMPANPGLILPKGL
jgi:hypothetical protein